MTVQSSFCAGSLAGCMRCLAHSFSTYSFLRQHSMSSGRSQMKRFIRVFPSSSSVMVLGCSLMLEVLLTVYYNLA